jgi:anion-transporting  ArsA/GET3 family ATPase
MVMAGAYDVNISVSDSANPVPPGFGSPYRSDSDRAPADLGHVLKTHRIVVCVGSGGVGKNTTSAALAVHAAAAGRRVLCLTIDPAKRLAQSLGLDQFDAGEQSVAPELFAQYGLKLRGSLSAMMLDMKHTFDDLIAAHASSPEQRDRILSNRLYQYVSTSLAGTQEYMAMEKLGQLLAEDRWDLVVVDTPPSRNALDFLDAPKRLGGFMDSRLWKLLLGPGRGIGKLVSGAMGLAMRALSTVLGSQMLSDAAAFVQSLDATFGGFREKADRTYELLKRRGTQFVVVSAAEPDALREASFFIDRLSSEHMPLAGLILNRTHPTLTSLHADKAEEAADSLAAEDPESLTAAVLRIHAARAGTAKREVRLLSRFTGANPHVSIVGVPSLPFDVSDLEALRAIADQITGEAPAA